MAAFAQIEIEVFGADAPALRQRIFGTQHPAHTGRAFLLWQPADDDLRGRSNAATLGKPGFHPRQARPAVP